MRFALLRRSLRLFVVVLLSAPGCVSIQLGRGRPAPLVETRVQGDSGPKILLLDIHGIIRNDPEDRGPFVPERESMVARVVEQLDRAREDDAVRALLVRINSPGGAVTASDVLYSEIAKFKAEREIPVVAQIMGTGASGGYYAAMAADMVMAHPTSVVGSIGVIFIGVNVVGLMEKLGIENQTLTAGVHKDAGSPLRRMTRRERAHFQSVLDDLHERFKKVVADSRSGLDERRLDEIADGSIYSAEQALALGLIDAVGDLDDAIAQAEERAGLTTSRVVRYHRPREWKQNLYSRAPVPDTVRLEIGPPFAAFAEPGFYYLWGAGAIGGG